ncbi:transcriptional regulator [Salmonella bongori]|nr:transcriptional regulator [Salmonella bongori]
MDKLEAMQVYVCVVDTHSFIRAAEVLGVPRSTVSRGWLKNWNPGLGFSFCKRTTRKLSVTAEGPALLRRVHKSAGRYRGHGVVISPDGRHNPKGVLKWGMPQSLARHCIIPHAPGLFAPVSGAGADTLFQR